ncbi:MAG: mannitol dehydrogenase [Ponticaulis sp.]|nr:mannitol dehydrogenase [Ponticaulis sp.]
MESATQALRLNADTPSSVDTSRVRLPGFERHNLPVSVLHIGPGAFFRAHQMDYFDQLNAVDPSWGVMAIALRSRKTPEALARQNGLYTLVTLDEEVEYRLIGSLLDVEYFEDASAFDQFLQTGLRLITLTITEKGYCLGNNGKLDLHHPDIAHDVENPNSPVSAIGWLVKGFRARQDAGMGGLTVLSCDNLPANGAKLKSAVLDYAEAVDPALSSWIEQEVYFPSSMVDSITPATDASLIERVEAHCGYADAWPIQREAFTSWVIERIPGADLPAFDRVGAILTEDVEQHEQAKLRLLNGAHSTLAYAGLACGEESVATATANSELHTLIANMMRDEIKPSLEPPEGLDLDVYIDDLLRRFANPAIIHKLSQIAWDGSKKLPIRLLDTVRDNLAAGRSIEGLATGVAAWMRFIIRMTQANSAITDPMADRLKALAKGVKDTADHDVDLFLSLTEIFEPELVSQPKFSKALKTAYDRVMVMEKSNLSGEEQS